MRFEDLCALGRVFTVANVLVSYPHNYRSRAGLVFLGFTFLWKELGDDRIEIAMVNSDSSELIEEWLQLVLTD